MSVWVIVGTFFISSYSGHSMPVPVTNAYTGAFRTATKCENARKRMLAKDTMFYCVEFKGPRS